MDDLLTLREDTLFRRCQALDSGYDDKDLKDALRSGVLARVRHGAYCAADRWAEADEVERYRLTGRAVVLQSHGNVALSHTSAAVEHGLSLWRPDLSQVHVVRLDGKHGRQEAGVNHHVIPHALEDLGDRDGITLVAPAHAAIGAAQLHDVEEALVVTDSYLWHHVSAADALQEAWEKVYRRAASRHLQVVMRLTRPGAQTPLETRSRHLMWRHHLPAPELQFPVHDLDGTLVGITDFAWPEHRLLGEADGRIKLGRLLGPNPTPEQVQQAIVREKYREDRLRELTGFLLVRIVWDDLARPGATAARLRRMLQAHGRLGVA